MKKHRSILFLSLFLLFGCLLQAQTIERQVLSAGGDNASTTDLQISWTIGETAVQTANVENKIVTEGFQQPVLFVERVNDPGQVTDQVTENVQVYPNPASHSITIQPTTGLDAYSAELFNLEGKMLTKKQLSGKAQVDISPLPQGMYILRILSEDKSSESSFRISKM